jgi:hypothetical protein
MVQKGKVLENREIFKHKVLGRVKEVVGSWNRKPHI